MADKVPVKANFTGSDVTSLGEFGTGDTIPLANGGTGATTASGARTNLGLVPGTDVASLDGSGKIPSTQIPDIAISDYLGTVANQTAMLALTGQKGDWCNRSDTGTVFVISGSDPSVIGGWTQLNYPTAPVTSVAGKTGSVSLVKGDVGLSNVDNTSDASKPISTATQTALDGKQSQITSTGLLKGAGAGSISAATAETDYVTPTGTGTLSGKTVTGLKETKTAPAISAGTLTLDCSTGNVFAVSLNASVTTLTFTNVPTTGTAYALTLSFTADGTARTVAWGSSVKWPGGTAPTLTSTNAKVDTFVLTTWDGGTTWYAFTAGQNS